MSTLLLTVSIAFFPTVYGHFNYGRFSSANAPTLAHIEYRMNSFHDMVTSNNNLYDINVLDFGAIGDAKTDNTNAFSKALKAAENGGYVYVPSGQYLFNGQLIIPSGVTLIGTYLVTPYHKPPPNQPQGITLNEVKNGSILIYDGSMKDIFITMKRYSFIKGFSIFYPKQVANQYPPIKYNATISITGPNVAILDIELINPYIGITMNPGPASARHYIARIQGGPIYIGIFIDKCHDIGRIEDIHFKSGWYVDRNSFNSTNIKHSTLYWTQQYGVGYIVGDTDWEFMFNTFCIGYAIGYQFVETETGSPNGNFLGIASNATTNASVQVDSTKKWGISITNGEFVDIVISKTNVGNVHLSNCIFFGAAQYIARIYGDSSTSFENCEFHEWNATLPAIYSQAGVVKVIGSNFYQSNSKHIHFKQGTEKGIVVGNSFNGGPQIQHDNGVQYTEAANL